MRSLGYLKEHEGNLKQKQYNNPGYREIELVKKK